MIEDKETNIVYLSKWLQKEHRDFYDRFTSLLSSIEIKYDMLKYTNDFWCRDYMPIQLDNNTLHMKKFIYIAICVIALSSCNSKTKWEYKVVKVTGQREKIISEYVPLVFDDQTPMLNKMGEAGWELVNTYTETNTAYPNFGNSEYVTGIRGNTRTSVLNFVFKRPQQK